MSRAARRRLDAFRQRFLRYGQAHLDLARQAAVPLALTPDLLYRLWAAFQRDARGAPLRIPWVAVADLLLSNLCREVGFELYELDREVRALLLDELAADARLGPQRRDEIARFLLEYVRQLQHSPDPDALRFAEAQQWAALAYLEPGPTLDQLRQRLEAARRAGQAELLRLGALAETLAPALREQPGGAELLAQARDQAALVRSTPAQSPAPRETAAETTAEVPDDWIAHLETRFVLARPDETLGQILARLPSDRRERAATYVVVPREDGRYLVAMWYEVELTMFHNRQSRSQNLRPIDIFNPSSVVDTVTLATIPLTDAQKLLANQRIRRLIVLEGGIVCGVLSSDPPLPDDLGPDPFALGGAEPADTEQGPLPPTPMSEQTFGQSDELPPHEQPPDWSAMEQGPLPPTLVSGQTFGQTDGQAPDEAEVEPDDQTSMRLPLELGGARQSVTLNIRARDDAYEVMIIDRDGRHIRIFRLNMSSQRIDQLAQEIQGTWAGLLHQSAPDGDEPVYLGADTSIPAEIAHATLQQLARQGYWLYQLLLLESAEGVQLTELLQSLAREGPLTLRINAERFTFPWALLYDRPQSIESPDIEGFWGFRWVIEHTAEAGYPDPFSHRLPVEDMLETVLITSQSADAPEVRQLRQQIEQFPGSRATVCDSGGGLRELIGGQTQQPQIVYFYGDAGVEDSGGSPGFQSAWLALADQRVHLGQLPLGQPFQRGPLVFLNSPGTAPDRPGASHEHIGTFLRLGARTVIAADAALPARFAAEFGREFLTRFAAGGQPAGELLLNLRRAYATQRGNPLGLLYSLHGSAGLTLEYVSQPPPQQPSPQRSGGVAVAPLGPPTTLDGLLVELRALQAALEEAALQLGAPGEDAADALGAAVRALERSRNFARAHAKLSEALDRLRTLEGTATIAERLYMRLVEVASFFEQIWSQSETGGQSEAE